MGRNERLNINLDWPNLYGNILTIFNQIKRKYMLCDFYSNLKINSHIANFKLYDK